MILEIPLSADPAQSFVVQLDDVKYRFDVLFNDRSGVWVMDLAEENSGRVLLQSIPLLLGSDLLEPYNLGIGRMMVVDENNRGKDATADDLGTRVKLYWFSPDEVL